jgi:hypothetical protein
MTDDLLEDDLLDKVRTWPTVTNAARQLMVSRMRVEELLQKGRLKYVTGPFNYRLVDPATIAVFQHERTQRKARLNRRRAASSSQTARIPAKTR